MKYLLLLLILLPGVVQAQYSDELEPSSKLSVGMMPQYAFIRGLRMDVDIQIDDRNALIVAPQLYAGLEGNWFWNYSSMWGVGVDIQHRRYMQAKAKNTGLYFGYGPMFQTFGVTDDALIAQTIIEDGVSYVELVQGEETTQVFKTGFNFIIGMKVVSDLLYVDPFIGLGVRGSFDNKKPGFHREYDDIWYDMGYTGMVIVGGFRIGLTL